MAVEEPSVVAAASNAARMARAARASRPTVVAPVMIGQIQLIDVADVDAGAARAARRAPTSCSPTRAALVPRLAERGGGPRRARGPRRSRAAAPTAACSSCTSTSTAATRWARTSSTRCARRSPTASRALAGGRAGPAHPLEPRPTAARSRVRCAIADAQLASDGAAGADVRAAIAAASRFAELDPYRAATHNKGIMNGVDAVLIATGNDWRAVEAGAHAYAARTGALPPARDLARATAAALDGELVMPLAVGTVGGALHVHPGARLALELAGVDARRSARRARGRRRPRHEPRGAARARDRGHPARPHGAARPRPRARRRRHRRARRSRRRRARRHAATSRPTARARSSRASPIPC